MSKRCAEIKREASKPKQVFSKIRFLWTEEAESAFKQMKELIAKLPMLIALEEKEELIIYLAASKEAVSVVLMTEREAKQMPIYFVSRALRGPEVNYTSMEKLVLALVHASKRLRRYWPRISVKGQVLADFIVERLEEENLDAFAKEEEPLFTNGSSCVDGCEAGVILTNPEGIEFTYALRFQFKATNNEAEYEALIAGLWIAEKMGVQNLQVNVDSKLVANQVNRTYIAKETDMVKYLEKVKTLAKAFREFLINQVPRKENKKADALSKMASTSFAHLSKQVLVEELKEKSVNEVEVLAVVEEEGDSWKTPIQEYLNNETLPTERKKARSIKRKSQREIISDNGKQFRDNPFRDWCEKLCIQQHFASVKHPQMNGMVERANRSLGEGIKARLGKDNKNWWKIFLMYFGTLTAEVDVTKNNEALEINLELLEEKREQAAIREAKSKRQMEKYYNTKVRNACFKPEPCYRSKRSKPCRRHWKVRTQVGRPVRSHRSTWKRIVQVKRHATEENYPANPGCLAISRSVIYTKKPAKTYGLRMGKDNFYLFIPCITF
ncbi:reverse transcriptase domain-containing protein [Tanacetum coccineum]